MSHLEVAVYNETVAKYLDAFPVLHNSVINHTEVVNGSDCVGVSVVDAIHVYYH